MYKPLVSIVIPVFNGGNYLREAIDSALAQTYEKIEIILVNDGSTDNGETEAIAGSYGNRLRYYHKANGGSSSALNEGIRQMNGEWFSWLSHDDLYYPQKIERQVEYMHNLGVDLSEIDRHIFFTASELIDQSGSCIRTMSYRKMKCIADKVEHAKDNRYFIAEPMTYCFHGCSCLIHRNVFSKVGAFNEALRLVNDIDMWHRLYINKYTLHFVPEVLVKGRIHAKQVSKTIGFSYHNPEQDYIWERCLQWLREHYKDDFDVLVKFGINAFSKTRWADGERAFNIAKEIRPSKRTQLMFIKTKLVISAWLHSVAKKIYVNLVLYK